MMDRGRGGGRGRATKKQRAGLPTSQQPYPESVHTPGPSFGSSDVSPLHKIPQSAPQRGNKSRPINQTPHRASSPLAMPSTAATSENHSFRGITPRADKPGRSNTFHSSFTFESPTNHGMAPEVHSARKRAKTFETATTSSLDGDDDAHSKGGHSLRKRTRIDYTQVIDDEIGLAAARNGAEFAPKATATAPTVARSRKRKGGVSQEDTDDDDDLSSTTKRRRADKSPAAPRAASRRRNANKKLPAGMTAYIDQPSDNDAVQDTILVGVSMEDEETEQSSYLESDSVPSSPEGRSSPRQRDQPPTPSQQPEPAPMVSQPVSVSLENGEQPSQNLDDSLADEAGDKVNSKVNSSNGLVYESAMDLSLDHVPETAPNSNSAQPQDPVVTEHAGQEQQNHDQEQNTLSSQESNFTHLQPTERLDEASHFIIATKSLQPRTENSAAPPQLTQSNPPTSTDNAALIPSSPIAEPPVLESLSQQQAPPSPGPRQQSAQEVPAVESAPGSFDGANESEPSTVVESAQPQAQLPATATASSCPVLRVPKPLGPARLPRLESIYEAETPFASALHLEPYEDEDAVLPGPYTEWVYPEEAPPTPTSMPTPTPTPIPMDNITSEVTWDVTRKLKRKEFDALHRQESKRRKEKGLPQVDRFEFHDECARLYQAAIRAHGQGQLPSAPQGQLLPTDLASPSNKPLPDSDALESQLPTAAPSPAAEDDGQLDGMDYQQELDDDQDPEQDEQQVPERQNRRAVDPIEVTKSFSKQYLFPKIRDPADFATLLENPEDLDKETLINYTAAAVEALHSYQQEFNELKKIIDDEENSKRRQANDKTIANWENRQKDDEPLPWRRHYDEPIKGPPPFELRGARAPKPYVDDPYLEYQREQDRVMAQAYGFKHNNHVSLIGRQNPEEQRWEAPETRLRERKRTEKAAELAEDNVVEGKRTRRPRQVTDQSKEASRAGTPALAVAPIRRQRKTAATAFANGDADESVDPVPVAETVTESPRKQRAAAAAARAKQIADEESTSSVTPQDSSQGDEDYQAAQPTKARKRNRTAATEAAPSAPATEATKPTTKGKRPSRAPTSAPVSSAPEIATASFYGNPSAASTQADSRPSTASSDRSDGTADTTESTYSLRDKRKRNFALENDPELEPRPQRRKMPQKSADNNPEPKAANKKPRQPRQSPLSQLPPAMSVQAPPAPAIEPALAQFSIAPQPVVPPPQLSGGLKAPTLIYSNSAMPASAPVLAPAKASGQPPGLFLHTFNSAPAFQHGIPPPPAAPPAIKKPITRIKLTNTTGLVKGRPIGKGSRGGGKPGGSTLNAEGKLPTLTELQAEAPEKSYSEMSKSEKMSYSMRRRWASGEMQGAVEKRRTTLANKKAEKATGRPGEDSAPGSANHSGASTPQPQSQMLPQPPQAPPPQHIQHPLQGHPPPMGMMMVPGPLALPGGPPPLPLPQGPVGLVQPRTLQPPPAMQHPQPWGPPIVPGQGGQMVFSFPSAPHPLHGHPGHPGPMN
ncbi:hypothetical protein QBC40DRAFT_262909 [Triangularia verruculosa]|uniref:Uncharacterized protein n=1 Tax=Triangularia verruculosa TaxID=2587418 RepID=A0AAN6XM85_9PEZI|nr:hypothetical protein QBC40DRAFT_262909 [Triangularia verruculosa]